MNKPYSKYGGKLPPLEKNFDGSHLELNKLPKLGNIKIKDNQIFFINDKGNRQSLVFKNKNNYSQDELIKLLEELDNL